MNQHYKQDYTKEQIGIVLQTIKDCIRENRYRMRSMLYE